MERSDNLPVLVLVRDLVFSSRISAAARATGAALRIVREPGDLGNAPGRRLIVDLNQPGALEAAVGWKQWSSGEVVGFVSHVDSDTIARARSAGIEQVIPRSRFVAVLPDFLT